MRYIEPPQEFLQKYSELYTQIDMAGGMRITDIQHAIGAVSAGSAVRAIAALETLGCCYGMSRKLNYIRLSNERMR